MDWLAPINRLYDTFLARPLARWRGEKLRQKCPSLKVARIDVEKRCPQILVTVFLYNTGDEIHIRAVRLRLAKTAHDAFPGINDPFSDKGNVRLQKNQEEQFPIVWTVPVPGEALESIEIEHSEGVRCQRPVEDKERKEIDCIRNELGYRQTVL